MFLDKKTEVFLAVAETGSFSRAARQLGTSQSGISFHVDKLESNLGVELFERRSRGVRLTRAGELLLEEARELSASAGRLEGLMAAQSASLDRQLELAGDAVTCVYTLPWTIAAFRASQPHSEELRFRYRHLQGDALVEALEKGDIDLALTGQRPHDRRLSHQTCFKDEVILVGSPDSAPASLEVGDLASLPLIWLSGDLGLESSVSRQLQAAGLAPGRLDIVMEVGDFSMLKSFLRARLGLAFVPRLTVTDELHYGLLEEKRVEGLEILRDTYLIFPKRRPPRELVASFIDFVSSREPTMEMPSGNPS